MERRWVRTGNTQDYTHTSSPLNPTHHTHRPTCMARPPVKAEGQDAGFIWMSTGLASLWSVAQAKREGPKNVVTAGRRAGRRAG